MTLVENFETDPTVDLNGWSESKTISYDPARTDVEVHCGLFNWRLSGFASDGQYWQITKNFDMTQKDELKLWVHKWNTGRSYFKIYVGGVEKYSTSAPVDAEIVIDISGESGSTEVKLRHEHIGATNDGVDFDCLYITDAPSVELLGIFDVGQDSEDLLGIFEGQTSADLLAGFMIRQIGSEDFPAGTCIHTPRVAQDLDDNTWTEYDAGAFLDHDCNWSWWTDVARGTVNTSLTKDVGAVGLGSDFFHEFTLNVYGIEETSNGALERICAWAGHLAIAVQDFYGSNDLEIAALVVIATDVADEYQLMLIEKGGDSVTMATKWVNFQDRYIVIYKQGTHLVANAYQDAAHTILEDSAEITLTADHNFRYVSMPMAWGNPGAETSSGLVDPIFGSMENLLGIFTIRKSASEDLLGIFISRQESSQDLLSIFTIRKPASENLLGIFISQQEGSQDLLGEFAVRRDGSQDLAASFVGQATQNLLGEFVSRQSSSQDLASKFAVNYWYHVSHLVINVGSINAGNVQDTRQDDGNDLQLNEILAAPAFDYEFHFKNVPVDQLFGIRLNGFYVGNPAHIVKLREWNFTGGVWDDVTNAVTDLPDEVVEQDYAWMGGGSDYVSGGEYRLKIIHTNGGAAGHFLNIDYLWLDEAYAEDQELLGEFLIRQIGFADLLGEFVIRHSASLELHGAFNGQAVINLPGEFTVIRSTQKILPAEFVIRQTSEELPGQFISRPADSAELLGILDIVHSIDLDALFEVQHIDSAELLGMMVSRHESFQNLPAEFLVYNADASNLLGGFIIRHSFTGTGVIIARDPHALFNYNVDVGTGFLSSPGSGGADKQNKVDGEASHAFRIKYLPDQHDYISFGWRYRYPQVPTSSRDLRGSFTVKQLKAVQLACSFLTIRSSSSDLPSQFEILQGNEDLKCVFEVIHFDFFGPWVAVASNPRAVEYPFEEKVYHYLGRHWLFYIEDRTFRYIHSLDGENWSVPSDIISTGGVAASDYGRQVSIWVDSGIVHYAICTSDGFAGNDLWYMRGTLAGDGSIAWDPRRTVIDIAPTIKCMWPTICCDVNGYPYIVYYSQRPASGQGGWQKARIAKSDTKDGTWTMNANYPAWLSSNDEIRYTAKPIPLDNGKIFAFYGGDARQEPWWPGVAYPFENEFLGRLADGTGVEAEDSEAIGSTWDYFNSGAVVHTGNDVIAAIVCADNALRVCKWETATGDWGTPVVIQTGLPAETLVKLFRIPSGITDPEKIAVLWLDLATDELRYKVSVDGGDTWSPTGNTNYVVLKQYSGGFTALDQWTSAYQASHVWGAIGFTFINDADELMYGYIRASNAIGVP